MSDDTAPAERLRDGGAMTFASDLRARAATLRQYSGADEWDDARLMDRAADAIDALELAVNIQDRMAENYAAVELQRLELAAVIEKVGRIVDYHPDSTVSFQVSNALAAPADALREHDAALIESLADEWSEWETFTASDGYRSIRQHGLSPNDWLRARAQQIREERADG